MAKNLKLLLYGGVGLAAGTTLALVFPQAEGVAGTALMLVLSLSAALCGAAVPGMIHFQSKSIRATGATVFFVLPWLIPPASFGTEASGESTTESSETAQPPEQPQSQPDRPNVTVDAHRIRIPKPEPESRVRRPRTVIDSLFAPKRT